MSLSEKERSEQRAEILLNEIEGRTDEELARLERIIMEGRGRATVPANVAPVVTTLAQPSHPRSRCSGISFDVSVCMEENTEGKMDPERGNLESSLAGTDLEAPGQQCLSN